MYFINGTMPLTAQIQAFQWVQAAAITFDGSNYIGAVLSATLSSSDVFIVDITNMADTTVLALEDATPVSAYEVMYNLPAGTFGVSNKMLTTLKVYPRLTLTAGGSPLADCFFKTSGNDADLNLDYLEGEMLVLRDGTKGTYVLGVVRAFSDDTVHMYLSKSLDDESKQIGFIWTEVNTYGRPLVIDVRGMNRIPPYAFRSASIPAANFYRDVTTINIPSSIHYIDQYAFANCKSLVLSSLPEGLINIDTNAFQNCTSITSLTFPTTLTIINANAFSRCTGLTTVTFLSTLTTINATAFANCSNITDIYVPWSEGTVADAPWGATNATIHYDYTA
jgi:hypothetical protein